MYSVYPFLLVYVSIKVCAFVFVNYVISYFILKANFPHWFIEDLDLLFVNAIKLLLLQNVVMNLPDRLA